MDSSGTFVNIAADGSVDLVMDRYYEETELALYYFQDGGRVVVNFDVPTTQPGSWGVFKPPKYVQNRSTGGERRWQIIFKGPKPGVFERWNNEWVGVEAPEALDFHESFERAKAVFASAVQQGNVIRTQDIVEKEALCRQDQYLGQTTDLEILNNTKEWHIVTFGREPGIFSSESYFERNSTRTNIRGIDGGTISVYNTARLAVRSFSEALNANRVVRVSMLHIREVMRATDFPGLIEPWKF